jgi:hypothetical protein
MPPLLRGGAILSADEGGVKDRIGVGSPELAMDSLSRFATNFQSRPLSGDNRPHSRSKAGWSICVKQIAAGLHVCRENTFLVKILGGRVNCAKL